MNAKDIVRVNNSFKAAKSLWMQIWQEIADNMVFRKQSIIGKWTPGQKATALMYDSTALAAGQDLAAWINGNMTGRGMNWFSLKRGGGNDGVTDKGFQEWLEAAAKLQLEEFRASNFASEWNEVLLDLVFFCTGALFMEENEVDRSGFNGFNFLSLPPGTYSPILDHSKRTKGLFRDLELTAENAIEKFGDKSVGDDIKKSAEKDPGRLWKFVHACFPKKWFGGKHRTQKEFVSYYVREDKPKIMRVGGYSYFPYFVIPWLRQSGEDFGRGPGFTALPEVKTANTVGKLTLKEWGISILPPLTMVNNGVIGTVRYNSAGLTVVKTHDALKPLLTGAKHSQNREKREDQRTVIRNMFYGDKIQYIPPREQTGQMTAYEVARRYQVSQMLLGPTFGNIIDHGLDPLVEAGFNLMNDVKAFGDRPEFRNVEIVYESPLAKSQRVTEVEAVQNTLVAVGGIAEVKPDVYDNFKLDETALYYGEMLGYPANLINSPDERKKIRDERAKKEADARALEQAALAAKAAKDGASAVKDLPPGVVEAVIEG